MAREGYFEAKANMNGITSWLTYHFLSAANRRTMIDLLVKSCRRGPGIDTVTHSADRGSGCELHERRCDICTAGTAGERAPFLRSKSWFLELITSHTLHFCNNLFIFNKFLTIKGHFA